MIPKLHYISQGINAQEHLNNIQAACTSGVELVQLRLKKFDTKTVLPQKYKLLEYYLNVLEHLFPEIYNVI